MVHCILCIGEPHVEHDVETCGLTSGPGASVEQDVGTCGLTFVPGASSL
ncbi:hypothetical protein A2U01_0112008, partial [Trifolium medium]|nr:hypothetical protein [Trifolium medium]